MTAVLWLLIILSGWLSLPSNTLASNLTTEASELLFKNYTFDINTTHPAILSLYQDKLGFLWIGTFEGLKRFDGHHFKTYQHIPGDQHTLKDNSINEIIEDEAGRMWVGTNKGHNLYQPTTDRFKPFERNPPEFLSTKNANIHQILTDSHSLIWVITKQGLFQFNPQNQRMTRYQPKASAMFEDRQKNLWVGTLNSKLLKYNRTTDDFLAIDITAQKPIAITDIKQDKTGTLWLATNGVGLLQFNPLTKSVIHHQHNPKSLEGQSRNNIISLLFGPQNVLWVRSSGGLDQFDTATKTFTNQLKGQWVVKFFQTQQGQLWLLLNDLSVANKAQFDDHNLSKWSKRLALYDPTSQSFKMYLSDRNILQIQQDANNDIWVRTRNGLSRFDPKQQSFIHHLTKEFVDQLFIDSKQRLWARTTAGLGLYQRKTKAFRLFKNDVSQLSTLPDNRVNAIIEDQTGLIWLGTHKGLSKLDLSLQRFGFIKHHPTKKNSLSYGVVRSIIQNTDGSSWIGTFSGLNHYNPTNGTFKHYLHKPHQPTSLSDNRIWSLAKGDHGNLWVGTKNGLNRFNQQNQTFTRYTFDENNPSSPDHLSGNNILDLLADKNGLLWIGTNNGLNALDSKTGRFKHYTTQQGLSGNFIRSLYQDPQGILWVGTKFSGLNRFDSATQTFTAFRHNPKDNSSISDDKIYAINQDKTGQMWLGTASGLNRFNPKTQVFTRYLQKDQIPSSNIATILNDNQGNLWLGTFRGLVKFNLANQTFKSYGPSDGALCHNNSPGASFRAADGRLFIGSNTGYCQFYPKNIKTDQHPPTVVITDFSLLNQPVTLNPNIVYAQQIALTHQDRLFSFDFSALHFADPNKNQYAYQLSGYNKQWITTDAKKPHATYTNIPSGEYVFKVKAANKEGYWNPQPRAIKISIAPAPWRTWWAYLGYILLCGSIVVIIGYQRYQVQKALILAKNNAEKANHAKSLFIANISHEIRTPLNAVLGYTQMLDSDTSLAPQHKQKVEYIGKSGLHLLSLINDIIDITKIEDDSMQLHTEDFDLVALLGDVAEIFNSRSKEKQIDWRWLNCCGDSLPVHGDEGKLRQVLLNLLGNAVKFTEHGSVNLLLDTPAPNCYRLTVSDSGIGIAPEHQQQIFKAFSQALEGVKYGGTGLGLSIASKQVALMGGQLQLNSAPNIGSRFYFTLTLPPAQAAIESQSIKRKSAKLSMQSEQPDSDLTFEPIPDSLYQSITEAASDYEVSKLEGCLNELSQLNVQNQRLAKQLNRYMVNYDMEGLLKAIEKVQNGITLEKTKKEAQPNE